MNMPSADAATAEEALARQEALDRMIAEAESMHADAILTVRFSTASISAGAAELLAYGTAVTLKAPE